MIQWFRVVALVMSCIVPFLPVTHAFASGEVFSNTVVLEDHQGFYRLGRHLMVLEDPNRSLTIDDVQAPKVAAEFFPSEKEVPGFGFSPSAYWVRFKIDGSRAQSSQWVIEFGHSPMQRIDVYTVHDGKLGSHQRGGSAVPYADRSIPNHRHVFKLNMSEGEVATVFVRVDGDASKTIPLSLYRWDLFASASAGELALLGVYGGVIGALLLYNIFVSVILREKVYLFYAGFLFFLALLMLSTKGVSQMLISHEIPILGDIQVIPFSVGAATFFGALFMALFLDLKTAFPVMERVNAGFWFGGISVAILSILVSYRVAILIATVVGGLFAPWAIFSGLVAVSRGNRAARYFLVAWAMLAMGVVLYSLKLFGLLPSNIFTEYTWLWGSAAEAILLAVALAARMRAMKDENERVQLEKMRTQEILYESQQEQLRTQKALNAAQQESLENKHVALDTVQKYSARLEAEVKARTAELIETQQKLIATEKMSALGIFTAGMAHEINNPANFVAAGAQNAETQLDKFKGFVTDLLDEEAPEEVKASFDRHFEKLADSLSLVRDGVGRIDNVVKHLRATHPEGDVGMQPADIVGSLESAWRVFQPTIKIPVVLTTQFDARPSFHCMIADINQVFLALLSNAVHAIEDAIGIKSAEYKGEIRLMSCAADDVLVISVSDNGMGIATENMDKVFDPFFTTKAVGRGAGLGLSMARDIVKRHGGTLEVQSEAGEGATFALVLPQSHGLV